MIYKNVKDKVSDLLRYEKIYDGSYDEKNKLEIYNDIIQHHYNNSSIYRKYINNTIGKLSRFDYIQDIPYLPASIFKQIDFFSIKKKKFLGL